MTALYRAMMVTKAGGPEALTCVELPVEEPRAGQLRVRVRAAGVGSTDLMVLAGNYRYAPEDPAGPRLRDRGRRRRHRPRRHRFHHRPTGRRAHRPRRLRRVARARSGALPAHPRRRLRRPGRGRDPELRHRLADDPPRGAGLVRPDRAGHRRRGGRRDSGAADPAARRREDVRGRVGEEARDGARLGAIPIDYRAGRLDRLVRELEPRGVDCAFDAVGGANIGLCIRATRRGGTVVGYGFMGVKGTAATLRMFANLLVERGCGDGGARSTGSRCCTGRTRSRSARTCRRSSPSSPTRSSTRWSASTMPLLEARQAIQVLVAGSVEGKIVLTGT